MPYNQSCLSTTTTCSHGYGAQVTAEFAAKRRRGESIRLKRGEATIPLPGIDVPFHSRYLQGGVPSFRQVLLQKMDVNRVRRSLARLEQRYIPNVVAVPFEVTHGFVKVTKER